MKRGLLISILLFASAAGASAADKWWDYYKRGTDAVSRNDWPVVGQQMQKAIALNSQEDLGAKARDQIIVYVPHFWLGISRFKAGDVEGALREWKTSQSQGVIQKSQYYSDLRAWLARAQNQEQRSAGQASSGAKKTADDALNDAVEKQVEAMATGAGRLESFKAAQRKLRDAWDQYNKAGSDSSAYQRAAAVAREAGTMFASSGKEAVNRKGVRPVPAQTAASAPVVERVQVEIIGKPKNDPYGTAPPAQQTPAIPVPSAPRPEPAAVRQQVVVAAPAINQQELNRTREELQKLKSGLVSSRSSAGGNAELERFLSGSLQQLAQWERALGSSNDAGILSIQRSARQRQLELAQRLEAERNRAQNASLVPTGQQAPTAPAANRQELRAAYRSFAAGDLDHSEEIASEILNRVSRSEDAYLLRGCARYTKGVLLNQKQLLAAAAGDFAMALEINPAVGLDPAYFSPKLVSFFNEVRTRRRR